ncbi:MAG: DUF2752 domain-containing protein [Cytophagaceae bacterium]|jgi:hypothetical protein|nr:DUF2752 domain-containing protein [Cytophagaceae bacterium]
MSIIDWLEEHQLPCMHKFIFGMDCPGCGMQRAIIALLRGNIAESARMYPALIPIIVMLIFLVIHLKLKLKHGAAILVYLFIFNAAIITLNFICKLVFLH